MKSMNTVLSLLIFTMFSLPQCVYCQEELPKTNSPQKDDIPNAEQKSLGQKIKHAVQDVKENVKRDLSKTKEDLKGIRNFKEDLKRDSSKTKDGFVEFSDHVSDDAKTLYNESKQGFTKDPQKSNQEEDHVAE